MTNFIFATGAKNPLNDKCLGRRYYAVETAEQKLFSKSEPKKTKAFFNGLNDNFTGNLYD